MLKRVVLALLCTACAVFTAFVYTRKGQQGDVPPSDTARQGMLVWQGKNCQSCHQLYGLGGYLGPDLTNVAEKGDGYMRAFLKNGTARMPNFHLNDQEIAQLSAFLHWVDRSGKSKVPAQAVHWTGSYQL
ncbi:MAG: cytochrome c [Bacteroidetes bacterium]|nr:cytochrome c [Bacteroidota bacterium]MBS1630031.1 cytochrome c [Bacteroidota bacterium]